VNTKANNETCERLGQNAKRNATVRKGSYIGRQSRKSKFSAYQVLWKIVGRSGSRLLPSCVRPMS
jgi:hypothetical protein